MKARMWEWWRRMEREYQEKRAREDERRRQELRERARRQTPYEAEIEARKYAFLPFEELAAEMEKMWGVAVDWEELGMEKPRPRGVQVEILEARQKEESRRQKAESDRFAEGALMLVLTGKWTR